MSMLAEPRQKTCYRLVPKGKPLYDDPNSFGTKMLEKMGWSKGKGLGKNENGEKDFVRVRYKSDAKGVGFTDKDDQWTEHEKEFSGLLKSLNNSEQNSSDENSMGLGATDDKSKFVKPVIESLEEKSKNSKARVHYKKFTRGKDLSQYSEKDLANIFGKKSNFDNPLEEKKPDIHGDIETPEKFNGIVTLSASSSMHDYFKMKLEEKKNKTIAIETQIDTKVEIEHTIKAKKKRKREESEVSLVNEEIANDEFKEVPKKKKKKEKQNKNAVESAICETAEDIKAVVEETNEIKKKKKSKKNKEKLDNESIEIQVESHQAESREDKKIKKKKKRNDIDSENVLTNEKTKEENSAEIEDLPIISAEKNTKKKKKNKNLENRHDGEKISNIVNNEQQYIRKIKNPFEDKEHSVSEILTNKIKISQFCAEKFRHTDLHGFPGSSLAQINGYGLHKEIEIEIVETAKDIDLITRFWSAKNLNYMADNKYETTDEKRRQNYLEKVKEARKLKKKIPNFNVKHLKKMSVFKQVKV